MFWFSSLFFKITFPLFLGIDEQLAKHIAHFFIRDPISLFSGKIEVDDEKELEHFDVNL